MKFICMDLPEFSTKYIGTSLNRVLVDGKNSSYGYEHIEIIFEKNNFYALEKPYTGLIKL